MNYAVYERNDGITDQIICSNERIGRDGLCLERDICVNHGQKGCLEINYIDNQEVYETKEEKPQKISSIKF